MTRGVLVHADGRREATSAVGGMLVYKVDYQGADSEGGGRWTRTAFKLDGVEPDGTMRYVESQTEDYSAQMRHAHHEIEKRRWDFIRRALRRAR